MVRGIHNLNKRDCVAHIKKCKKLGITKLLCDGGGLYLRSTPTGAASWIFRYEIDGVGREMGLGSAGTYDLDEARAKARHCRQLRDEGKDPIAEKQAARAAVRALTASTAIPSKSFRWCLMKFVAFTEVKWRSNKHRRDWTGSLERHAYPKLSNGNKLIAEITMKDVLAILEPHWRTHNETMRRIRSRVEMVWDWAKGQGYCSGESPARWAGGLKSYLPEVPKNVVHFAALEYTEIPALVAELNAQDPVDDALTFCFLTAGRTKEVRLADWSEIDLASGIWCIPGSRMKAGEEHKIPLTQSMLELLERQPTRPRPGMPRTGFVFCGQGVRALSEGAMLTRFKALRPDATVHGSVRSSFSVWSSEVAKARFETRESCLAHRNDPVVRAYLRTTHIGERRELMTAWNEYILRPAGSNVTPLLRTVV